MSSIRNLQEGFSRKPIFVAFPFGIVQFNNHSGSVIFVRSFGIDVKEAAAIAHNSKDDVATRVRQAMNSCFGQF